MISFLKKHLYIVFALFIFVWFLSPVNDFANSWWFDDDFLGGLWGGWRVPWFERDMATKLTDWKFVLDNGNVKASNTVRTNMFALFYPSVWAENALYHVIRDITLWVMIIFLVVAWGSLLLNKKPEESKKHLTSLLYILLWWVLIYGANRLFWDVFNFGVLGDKFTVWAQEGIGWVTQSLIWKKSVFFVILSAIKAFAFFLAVIMIVITWFKVIAAGEWEKSKKLLKWVLNVVVALLIIKWVDFIYYVAADSSTFVANASNFIINVARLFAWIFGVITVIMVIVAWYLYITDGWSGANFKKASNILINILLSALVLFSFLLIAYQIFAEFQEKWDALEKATEQIEIQEPSAEEVVLW